MSVRTLQFICLFVSIPWAACAPSPSNPSELPAEVDYNWHIKPVLSDRCYKCHGPDDRARQANLRLDTQEGAYGVSRDDSTRRIILPGNADASVLTEHISSDDPRRRMPPLESNLSLSDHEISLIRKWINQGATWKPHWAFIPPVAKIPPEVQAKAWVHDPLDSFVLHKIESAGLYPSVEAEKSELLRRVTFDLTGLPPTIDELNSFLADPRPNAYDRVVDELLSRPSYGERMTSMWLDLARYADTHGYQDDRPRTMWPWRDWVVRAFNQNLPYDDFVTWQIAGDLLPDATFEQRLATGFNRNHAITQEGGVVAEEYLTEYAADRTNTTATAFLGITMECARCHDHKYDPILQEEYYSMFAFFNGIDEQAQISYFDLAPKPSIRLEDPDLETRILQTNASIDSLEQVVQSWPQPTPPIDWIPVPSISLESGLLAYLPFDSLQSLVSPANQGLHGYANTGLEDVLDPPQLIEGKRIGALAFDGENFLNLGPEADFDWHDRFSLSSWIFVQPHSKSVALLSKRNGEQKRSGYDLIRSSSGRLQLRLIHDPEHQITVASTRTVPPNSWVHVAATYDGSGQADGVNLYIDGSQSNVRFLDDTLQRNSILNGNGLLAGHWTPRNQTSDEIEGMKGGAMDDLRIHTRILTDVEVAYLADQSTVPNPADHYQSHHDPEFQSAIASLDRLRRNVRQIPHVMIMEERPTPRYAHVLDRGAYDAPLDSVFPSVPNAILPYPEELPRNRLGLAHWLTHEDNPLTARVAVNRIWQLFFGTGLVHTPEDFGNQGAFPSHPALLDYLAVQFIESGYDIKNIIKRIVLSSTYRQSSHLSRTLLQQDPENHLLARAPRKRLSAEMIRDNALYVSGLLNPELGGEPVRPYQPEGLWKALANQIGENRYRPGPDLHRRSLYTYWKRTIPPPAMLTFDAPDRSVCTVDRQATATPLQSLVLLNDPQYVEASRALASRVLGDESADHRKQIDTAFRWLTSRRADEAELDALTRLLNEQMTEFEQDPMSANELVSVGIHPVTNPSNVLTLAAMTVVTSTIMNLDEAQHR